MPYFKVVVQYDVMDQQAYVCVVVLFFVSISSFKRGESAVARTGVI